MFLPGPPLLDSRIRRELIRERRLGFGRTRWGKRIIGQQLAVRTAVRRAYLPGLSTANVSKMSPNSVSLWNTSSTAPPSPRRCAPTLARKRGDHSMCVRVTVPTLTVSAHVADALGPLHLRGLTVRTHYLLRPRNETPSELQERRASTRTSSRWFSIRPTRGAAKGDRQRPGELAQHLAALRECPRTPGAKGVEPTRTRNPRRTNHVAAVGRERCHLTSDYHLGA